MRIGLYGLPSAGKTHVLEKIDFINVFLGSTCLKKLDPEFDVRSEEEKNKVRETLAMLLSKKDNFIMDGHYAFGNKKVFTEKDGMLYDIFLYLYINPDILQKRMAQSEKNRKYLAYNIKKWQWDEIENLRVYCHKYNKDFYVLDNPPNYDFRDIEEIIQFLKTITAGFSCVNYARKCASEILNKETEMVITLTDGDKTITVEDSSHVVFCYKTNLFDGNFYTGFQAWKQGEAFRKFTKQSQNPRLVSINKRIIEKLQEPIYVLTSGHSEILRKISEYLHLKYYSGNQMSADTKFFITKFLQEAGKKVICYGDGMNDYYMLKQADKGYLVRKRDGSISQSLKDRDLGGIQIV